MNPLIKSLGGVFILSLILFACSKHDDKADGYGNFEATEVIISSEATGRLLNFEINEGDLLVLGDTVGNIDCSGLELEKARAEASLASVDKKTMLIEPELAVIRSQMEAQAKRISALLEKKRVLEVEQRRVQNLVADDAAPRKRLDDINGELAVLEQEIEAAKSQKQVIEQQLVSAKKRIQNQNQGILSERPPLKKQIERLDDQLEKCVITNPLAGRVLDTYAEELEFTAVGKPLYKIADLAVMKLRVYLSATQLPEVEIGQEVDVRVDVEGGMRSYPGTISWIADEAEFTPKIIQTREERVNLVYACLIQVPNDGSLKIGMPAEMSLPQASNRSE